MNIHDNYRPKPRENAATSTSANAALVTLLLACCAGQSAVAAQIEEIVVTAQKREQSLQDISISISAFTGDDISALGKTNLEELIEFVAGAELFDDRGAGQPTWVIRGVGLADFNANNTPTAAIYYDEYYLPSNVLGGIGLFDIERVEVLKGPQGGLYGRNAAGGAVQLISRAPDPGEDTNGYIAASYGRWDAINVEGAIGGAISDTTAYRIAAMTDQGGGWQDSLATPEDDEWGDRDFTAVKAQLSFQPSNDFDVRLKLEAGNNKSETTLALSRAVFEPGAVDFSPGFPVPVFCAAALAGRSDPSTCGTFANFFFEQIVDGTPGPLTADMQASDGSVVLTRPINKLDDSWTGITLEANWELTAATLTSITGYFDYENRQKYDFDATHLRGLEEDSKADLTSWSQELRLTSNGDGNVSWLAGVMIAEDEVDDNREVDATENAFLADATVRGFKQETSSWAAYGNVAFAVSDSVNLHGSARYTDEEKDFRNGFNMSLDPLGFFGGPSYFYQDFNSTTQLDSNWSGELGVDWFVSDDALIYAKATRGFKSGGFSGGFIFDTNELRPYAEEKVMAYEIGLKSEWLENSLRFNGAVFHYDYEDLQGFQSIFIIGPGGTPVQAFPLGNIGDAEHDGAEVDITWLPSELEGLSLQFSGSWLNAEISDSMEFAADAAGNVFPLLGTDRGFSPDFAWSAQARYEYSIGTDLASAIQINYSDRDDLLDAGTLVTPINLATSDYPGYSLLNASISLFAQDERWAITLSGQNLTDEEYATSVSQDGVNGFPIVPGRPRSWSLAVRLNW